MPVKFITYSMIPKDWDSYKQFIATLSEAEHYIVARILASRASTRQTPSRWAI